MAEEKPIPKFTWEEVAKHKTAESLWIVVNNKVYDVTGFMEEHPGGEEVLLDVAGQDATASFEDVGHSEDAQEMQIKYLIGTVDGKKKKPEKKTPESTTSSPSGYLGIITAILVLAVAMALYVMYQ